MKENKFSPYLVKVKGNIFFIHPISENALSELEELLKKKAKRNHKSLNNISPKISEDLLLNSIFGKETELSKISKVCIDFYSNWIIKRLRAEKTLELLRRDYIPKIKNAEETFKKDYDINIMGLLQNRLKDINLEDINKEEHKKANV